MDARREICVLIVCIFVLYENNVLAISNYGGPEIISSFSPFLEGVIEANDNYTMFCQGNRPLKWTTPEVEEEQRPWTSFSVQSEEPIDTHYHYGLRLNINNMSYPFFGFYYCHYERADLEDEDESAKVYLYVNDSDHLTTLKQDNAVKEVIATQFQEAILPCRPTSPDISVSLDDFTTGEKVPLDGIFEDTLYRYDPLYGFLTNQTRNVHNDKLFDCRFSRNDVVNIATVKLIVEIPVSHLALPDLRDSSDGHTVIGEQLTLECKIKTRNTVIFHWGTPNGPVDNKRMNISDPRMKGDKISQSLTVLNTTASDNGTYYCNVTDHQKHSSSTSLDVKIFDKNEYFLTVVEENNVYSITASAGESSVQWSIDVKGHPKPTVTWLDNRNLTIPMVNGEKYEASYKSSTKRAFLKIKNIVISDFGNYTLQASNNKTETSLSLFLNVTDKPTVLLETEPFYLVNTPSKVKCIAYANPEPEFQWYFKPCQSSACDYMPLNETVTETEKFIFTSEITINNASESGYIRCSAANYKGYHQAIKGFFVSDIENGFDIFGLDSGVDVNEDQNLATIAEGDTMTVTCGASNYNYSKITWLFRDKPLLNNDRYTIVRSTTQYSTNLQLQVKHVNMSDSGMYSCKVADRNGNYLYRNITFRVATPMKPTIINTTLQDKIEMELPDRLEMYCKVSGIPKPTLTWYKNGVVFVPSELERVSATANNEELVFLRTLAQDEGTYVCQATNKIGVASKQQMVKFKNLPRTESWLIIVIVLLSLVSIGTIIFIIFKVRKEKQLQRELKLLGLANFQKGAVENINPELGIDDQAELLPYDQKWEVPIDCLKLGKQLGSGAFGVVMKGVAKNIIEGENETTVAVKMVKKNADNTYIRALASELKIMVHLGKHLNVVNLLGACTKNVAKRELLVIVEFCRFGNLQNYLLRHRGNYIDQVDPKTGKIDYVIGQEFFDRSYSVSSDRSNTQSPSLKYAALTFSNSSNQPVLPPANNMGDYRANSNTEASTATDMTTVSQGEEGVVLSNNSVQPEWRSNYKGDYKGNVKPICTKDLLAWAFQVARGMEYLASRKVLHGDLAARNILLADNNVVKICDFGLAKSMYKNDNYKKRGDGPLPVKWMAIESIRDRVFSTQSDVWSFGIVLWEFFSLARTPYPGMEADERLYQKLMDGYRMESPQYAPRELYKMMTDCWSAKPLARPSFTKLSERLGGLLEDSLRKHYIDLNDPYLVMNTQRLEDGQSDYLSMLSPPSFEALSTPHYVNETIGQESLEDSGYLSMKPNTIFSPRVEEGSMFDFNVNNRKHLNSAEGSTMEMLPMLRRSDSGCETPLQSPTTPNSFSNPSYHIPPKIPEEEGDNNNSGIVKSPDNYVNMPQNKSFIKDKNMNQSNPFVDSSSETSNAHYVNGNSKDWESIRV